MLEAINSEFVLNSKPRIIIKNKYKEIERLSIPRQTSLFALTL